MNEILCIYAHWRYIICFTVCVYSLLCYEHAFQAVKVPLISSVCESHLTDYRTSNINLYGQMKEKGLDLVQSSWLYVILMTIRQNITIIY